MILYIKDIRTFPDFFNPYSVIWRAPIEKDFPYPFAPYPFKKVFISSLSYQTENAGSCTYFE